MDISTNDVLFLLGAIEVVACLGCALYWLIGRGAEARPARRVGAARRAPVRRRVSRERPEAPMVAPQAPAVAAEAVPAAEPDELSDSGRHHVPDHLLHSPTYRLSADLRARAKVPGQAVRPVDQFSDAG